MTPAFLEALERIPEGASLGRYAGRAYTVSKLSYAGGKSVKLVAHERGGSDYISLNVYHIAAGARLYPCEMPAEKVIAFVTGVKIDS